MKHILRLFFCLSICFVGTVKAVADVAEEAKYLVIALADDTFREFQLADKPVISFRDGKFVVEAAAAGAEFDRKEVKSFCFMAQSTAIERATADGRVIFRYVNNTTVSLAGLSDAAVSLHDAAGALVCRRNPVGGRVEISLETLAPGVYLLQYEKDSHIKFIKK